MLGRDAAVHIMVVLMTSRGVVAAAAKAPLTAPIAKSSCKANQHISDTHNTYVKHHSLAAGTNPLPNVMPYSHYRGRFGIPHANESFDFGSATPYRLLPW